MKVKEKMEASTGISPDDLLSTAMETLAKNHLHAVPVVYENEPIGILNKEEIKEFHDPQNMVVGEILKSPAYHCLADQTIGEAARIMAQKNVRRLVVLDSENNVTGIISSDDIDLSECA